MTPRTPPILAALPLLAAAASVSGCNFDTLVTRGEFGSPVGLGTGDELTLPRLTRLPGECPGPSGGCESTCVGPPESCPDSACAPILIDTLTPISALATRGQDDLVVDERACLEVRAAAGMMSPAPTEVARQRSITRFRFEELPTALAPADASGAAWDWRVGDQDASGHVSGVIGGNLLRHFSVRFYHQRTPGDDALQAYSVTLYRDLISTSGVLADQGRAFISVQFPGRLIGKDVTDVCSTDEDDCDFRGPFDFDNKRVQSALQPTRVVLDSCVAPPPASVHFDQQERRCKLSPGEEYGEDAYVSATGRLTDGGASEGCSMPAGAPPDGNLDARGSDATLVVATGVPGLVLFDDSARRMFGPLELLPLCADLPTELAEGEEVARGPRACREATDGRLYVPGWPAAGDDDAPLLRLKVRSVALVPGLLTTAGVPPCARLETRLHALRAQCSASLRTSDPNPGPASLVSPECAAAATQPVSVLGEVALQDGQLVPSAARWISTHVVPDSHPMVESLRRDVAPDTLQPDGLLGTALFSDTDVVIDYNENDPGLSVRCLDPDRGGCLTMPMCAADDDDDATAALARCCHGLPRRLLVDLINTSGVYACCKALSEHVRVENNLQNEEDGRTPSCPESNVLF